MPLLIKRPIGPHIKNCLLTKWVANSSRISQIFHGAGKKNNLFTIPDRRWQFRLTLIIYMPVILCLK